MKITDIQASVIGRDEPHSGGCVWTFVRVYTDEGLVGTGECNSASAASGFAVKAAIETMKPALLGKDPTNPGPLYELLRRRGRYGGTSNAPVIFAITGIENALIDITGKALGVPAYKLLGGKFRDTIRLYADLHAGDEETPGPTPRKPLRSCKRRATPRSSSTSTTPASASSTPGTGPSARGR